MQLLFFLPAILPSLQGRCCGEPETLTARGPLAASAAGSDTLSHCSSWLRVMLLLRVVIIQYIHAVYTVRLS